ncbi:MULTISPECIES: hypothetical protein [unclassified Knoellia]|uniref:hypothetical protein n=1 Tax=Knoellia altitudinis TaxID=3404795 RepID=UPI00361E25C9
MDEDDAFESDEPPELESFDELDESEVEDEELLVPESDEPPVDAAGVLLVAAARESLR